MTPSDENPRHYNLSLDIPDAFKEDFEDDEMDLKDIIMNQYTAELEDEEDEDQEQE